MPEDIPRLKFGVIGLDHSHAFGMIKGLIGTGRAECAGFHVNDPALKERMLKEHPGVHAASSRAEIFENPEIKLIVCASIFSERAEVTVQAMKHGKHVFVDKPPATTLAQLEEIEKAIRETGRCWYVWFSERLSNPVGKAAIKLFRDGAIGQLVNFIGLGPHKLRKSTRPDWMFDPIQYGGILNDICIHQMDTFTQLINAQPRVVHARVGNFGNPDKPGFQDFGDIMLEGPGGATGYVRVDWWTPDTMAIFGDNRNFIVGTRGMIEARKTIDLATGAAGQPGGQLILINGEKEAHRIPCGSKDHAFFPDLITDALANQNRCSPHAPALATCRAILEAQAKAVCVTKI